MNLKKYISIILIVICTTACVKEVIVEVPVVKDPEKVNVTLGVNTTTFTSRGTQDHYTTEPTIEEKRIFNYSILIFNAACELEAALTASPYNPAIPGSTGIEYTGTLRFPDDDGNDRVVELTSGQKQVFALVNAPQPLLDELEGLTSRENTTLQDFSDWILNVGQLGGMELITGTEEVPEANERGFLMTCVNGIQLLTIYPPLEENEVQNVLLTVGRAMAKVSVASDLTAETQPNGELTDMTYKIINNPYEMYIIPRFVNNELKTPEQNNPERYFDSPGSRDDNYTPISKKGSLTKVYCIEHAVNDPDQEITTTVILKGTYTPHTLYQANGTDVYTGYKKGDDFWRIAIRDGQRISYEEKYYGEYPAEALKEGQIAIKYIKGETYYAFYLRNDNSTSPYTVKRNSYYNIDITKVNHAGEGGEEDVKPEDPDPEDPDPEDPDPEDPDPGPNPEPNTDPRIEFSIRISDWQAVDQGVDF